MEILNSIGFFRIAMEEAAKSTHDFKVGAVISKSRPVARGHNKIKTHPHYANPIRHKKISIHAEIDCLIDHSAKLGNTIYVYREDKSGWPALARPCADCVKTLKEQGIRKMLYSTSHPPYYAEEEL